jgi:hypothetical protein
MMFQSGEDDSKERRYDDGVSFCAVEKPQNTLQFNRKKGFENGVVEKYTQQFIFQYCSMIVTS